MSGSNVRQTVLRYLDDGNWHYEVEERDSALLIRAGIGGFDGLYESYGILLVVGEHEVQSFAQFPANARNMIPQTAEFIARINSHLMFGSFLLNCDTGGIRFHLTFPAAAIETDTRDALDFLVFSPVQMLDSFAKNFSAVITGLMSPREAALQAFPSEG